jgi:hypothetical protein
VAILTFEVPNESETGSPTKQLSVALPNVTSAHTEAMPGWTARLDHDIPKGIFHSVTWTATSPNPTIPADQFALGRIEVTLPDTDSARFPLGHGLTLTVLPRLSKRLTTANRLKPSPINSSDSHLVVTVL